MGLSSRCSFCFLRNLKFSVASHLVQLTATRIFRHRHERCTIERMKMTHDKLTVAAAETDLARFDRILLHLRCLYHDRKYRWHLAGVWRELRGR
jgi:hypothetical protein